jgi:hypothetical protein
VAAALYVTGAAAVGPSIWILAHRYRGELRLLLITGYRPGYLRRLVAAIGALTAGATAAAGSVIGLVVVAVLRVRGLSSDAVLPLFWLRLNPVPALLEPAPSLAVGALATAAAALCGAVAALPAVLRAGTIGLSKDSERT